MAVHPVVAPIVTIQPGMFTSVPGMKTVQWSSSLFSCCEDMGTCCLGFWCPWCLACQVSSDFGECLCMPLIDIITGGMVPAAALAIRSSMRERYHIQGSMFDDCCILTYCASCGWCQMARELKRRRQPLLLNSAPSTTVEVNVNPMPNVPIYSQGPMQPMPAGFYPPMQ